MLEPNKFYNDIKEIINHWQKFNPTRCHLLGIHDYDGIFPNYSAHSITERIREIKEDIVHLIALKRDYSDPYTLFEFNLVKLSLEQELYDLDQYKEYTFNPSFYVIPLLVIDLSITVKSFASIDKRIEILTKYLLNLPIYLAYPKENLLQSLPEFHFKEGLNSFEGFLYFLQEGIDDFLGQSSDLELITTCKKANTEAISSLEFFIKYLKQTYGTSTHTKYALGKENFTTMLKKREFVNLSAEELLKIGQEDLNRNYSSLKSILDRHDENFIDTILNDIITEDQLLGYAKYSIERILQFVQDKDLVDIPEDEYISIIETPELIRRHGFAGVNPSGTFEKNKKIESYFMITLPDPNWEAKQRTNYYKIFNKAIFENIVISEVYPGEFLKFLFEKYKTKSIISKLFSKSSSMIEGYANYVLELMIEQEYNPWPEDCDKIKIGQLVLTLIRNVRFMVAIGIHCFGMSIDEAKELFKQKALLTEETANLEVQRALAVPMYLNYTLGKLLIKKLKQDYKKEQNEKFSLKQFHNDLLSFGSAPIALLRQVMLRDNSIIPEIL